jgi:UDP-N-acetylglucosamine 2-epimerase (non-hydrolysing)
MSGGFFRQLDIPAPDVNLEVGSGSHAVQTAEIMRRFERVIDENEVACTIVVGDVNSTLACALVAAKKMVPVVHVEAGLRSFDRSMPEEINRVLTDQISDVLYTTERSAQRNLEREGVDSRRVAFVGNLMIDSLRSHLPRAVPVDAVLAQAGMPANRQSAWQRHGVVTLHRPSNVDDPVRLRSLLISLREASRILPLIWPMHPRTRANIERFGLSELLDTPDMLTLPPQGYLEMLGLMSTAPLVMTDSGGIQEETTALGVPCITLRDNTERPITVDEGTNTVVGRDHALIISTVQSICTTGGKRGRIPELWDGHAAERIAAHLGIWLRSNARTETIPG